MSNRFKISSANPYQNPFGKSNISSCSALPSASFGGISLGQNLSEQMLHVEYLQISELLKTPIRFLFNKKNSCFFCKYSHCYKLRSSQNSEPRYEKTGFLHMRKQRRRSAVQ